MFSYFLIHSFIMAKCPKKLSSHRVGEFPPRSCMYYLGKNVKMPDPQLQSYLASPNAPIFFLYYPLTIFFKYQSLFSWYWGHWTRTGDWDIRLTNYAQPWSDNALKIQESHNIVCKHLLLILSWTSVFYSKEFSNCMFSLIVLSILQMVT